MTDFNPGPPDAVLLLSSQCPHCPTVLQGLTELLKQGVIGRLEAINIGTRPDIAAHYGARSVPWIKLGEFELQGLHSAAELREWAERAGSEAGLVEYYAELLQQGQLPRVLHILEPPARRDARATLEEAGEVLRVGVAELPADHGLDGVQLATFHESVHAHPRRLFYLPSSCL